MKARRMEQLILVIETNIPVSISHLAHRFDVSTRTIHNDVRYLNDFLSQNNFPLIESKRNEGMILKLRESELGRLEKLLSSLNRFYDRDERILDIILQVALSQEAVYLNKKEEEFAVSKSTIDEDVRIIRSLLLKYHIELIYIPKKGLNLRGSEQSIRLMLFSLLSRYISQFRSNELAEDNINQVMKRYIADDIFTIIEEIVEQKYSELERHDIYRKNVALFTYIWIKRIMMNYHLIEEEEGVGHTSNQMENIIEILTNTFSIKISLTERKYINIILQSLDMSGEQSEFDWVNLQIIVIQLIDFVENTNGISFTKKLTALHRGLDSHLRSMFIRVRQNIQFTNPLTKTIMDTYTSLFEAVKEYFQSLQTLTIHELTDDELAFITIHFSLALTELNQLEVPRIKLAVVCNHGVATGQLLAANLVSRFNVEIVGVYSSTNIKQIENLDIDLILTTIDMDNLTLPTLKVEPIITEDNAELIRRFLNSHKESVKSKPIQTDYTHMLKGLVHIIEQAKISENWNYHEAVAQLFENNDLYIKKEKIQPMIKDILKNDDVLIHINADTWEEAIRKVAQPLLYSKAISQQYVEAMIDSVKEYGPYIVMGEHFALAHARPTDGANALGLSIATLAEPIYFGHEENDPVKVIFCLSAIDSYSHLNIMKEIVNLINSPNKIDDLAQTDNLEELRSILLT